MANVTGTQIGSYFGYSVATGDLNGDGRDDVIIGAPMWTNYDIMSKFETGRVYVVFQDQEVNKEVKSDVIQYAFQPWILRKNCLSYMFI